MCQNKLDPDHSQRIVGPDLVQTFCKCYQQMIPEEKELPYTDPDSFVRGGPFLQHFFYQDPNNTISGPSPAPQQNAIQMAFPWRADDDPTLNAGLVALSFLGDQDQYC